MLSSLVDQEAGHQMDNLNLSSDELHRTYTVEEFEVRILEPEKSGGPWETKATIPMQSSENALTVRVVTLFVSSFVFCCSGCFSLGLCASWFWKRADLKGDRMHVFVLDFYREHDRRPCLIYNTS